MKFQRRIRKKTRESRKLFISILEKAGIETKLNKIAKQIFKVAIIINIFISGFVIYKYALTEATSLSYILTSMFVLWTASFIGLLLILWLIFFFIVDFKIYRRKIGIETVLPDFLQLTSANIRAGMPIDQALWHAIRPNFGVLAKEIEDVAKETMSGTELEFALDKFSRKYDSTLVQRSISLLIEGLNAGGEIGELLNRISTNIQESRMIQKEMAASVTTYAIFISIASIAGAPFLLALSSQLLGIIQNIISNITLPETSTAFAITFSEVGVSPADFKIFAMVTLILTSIISASIVAIIKKGNIKEGLKYYPMFILTALALFYIMESALGLFVGGIF